MTPAEPDPPASTPTSTVQGIEGGGIVRRFDENGQLLIVGSKQLDVSDPNLMVSVDDMDATLSDLKIGQAIEYAGTTADDGLTVAVTSIRQDDLLEGQIDAGSIDLPAGTFSVLFQPVRIDANTVFAVGIQPNGLGGLADGQFVEVTGTLGADGVVLASRIDIEAARSDVEVTGRITAVNLGMQQFSIGGLTVDYASAVLEDFNGDPAIEDLVEVEGAIDGNGVLVASFVEFDDEIFDLAPETALLSIEGTVTTIRSANEFELNGQSIAIDGSTQFDDGLQADLIIGVRVEVDAVTQEDGSLLARKIDFSIAPNSNVELVGGIDGIDTAAETFQLLGVTVESRATTTFDADQDGFAFADLAVGIVIEVDGFLEGATLIATKIKLGDEEVQSIKGPLQRIDRPELAIGGVTILTDGSTEFGDEGNLSADDFFGSIVVGDTVEAEGSFNGGMLLADEIERDDD